MSLISTSSLPVSFAARPSLARRSRRHVRSGPPAASRPTPGVSIRPVGVKAAAKAPEDDDSNASHQEATPSAITNLAMLSAGAAWLSAPGAVHAATDAAAAAAASSDMNLQAMGMEILVYFAKTLISWGIPGAVAIVVVILATARSKGPKKSGDEGDDQVPPFLKPFMAKGKDEIAPKEFLKVTPLNDRLESYSYSLTKATDNKARATSERRRQLYKKNFGDFVGDLSDDAVEAVLKAEKAWRTDSAKTQQSVNDATRALRAESVASAPTSDSEGGGGMGGMMKGMGGSGKKKELQKALTMAVTARAAADDKYIQAVSKVLTKTQREEFTKMLNKKTSPGWQDAEDPIALAPLDGHENKPKRVFVLKFNGDVQASQVRNLREEVTAVIRSAEKDADDEVLLVLNTGGGTVTGYGLAAAQLVRIKEAGLKLTICVEQVAASGGYMMACCADRIVASPFAVLGSIGVISEQPNVYDRLKREGIEFQTVTAGKYKRTLTPFKKPTEEDFAKNKEDIEQVLVLFKDFVNSQRPAVNIDEVATGETWFGPDALAKGLVDELKTVDDVLLEMLEAGAEIFSVAFSPATNPIQQLVGSPSGSTMSAAGGIFAPLGLLLENAAAAAFARQLEQQQQQLGAQNGIRILDPNQTADSVKAADGSASDSSSDLWFM